MNVVIDDLGKLADQRYQRLKVGQPAGQAFPELYAGRCLVGLELSEPRDLLLNALIWSWLEWHRTSDFPRISRTLGEVVGRSLDVYGLSFAREDPRRWEYFESFLIQCAILTGCQDTWREVATRVKAADPGQTHYQFVQAWTGVLKYRILGLPGEEQQLEVLKRKRSARVYAWPANKLVECFVRRDGKGFSKAVKIACEKHWEYAEQGHAVTRSGEFTHINLHFRRKNPHFLWPWVEAAFTKLALLDGTTMSYDSFWFPLAFVRAMATPSCTRTLTGGG